MSEIIYRWLDGPTATAEEWTRIDDLLAARGWSSLNRPTSRILVAEVDGELAGFHVFQLYPHAEPQWVRPKYRGTEISATLADKMLEFLMDIKVRGFMVVADSPFAIELCEARGMTRLDAPVYIAK
jgi:hypothetical protein